MAKKYTIKKGDTLGKISLHFYGTPGKYREIAIANKIINPSLIKVGQVLSIPNISVEESVSTERHTTTLITDKILENIAPTSTKENRAFYLDALNTILPQYEITGIQRLSHFLAQILHESGALRYSKENLNYSANALRSVFGKYFTNDEIAEKYARQPDKIANRIYANRMNNGSEESGDGWHFKGRGLIQITGKSNYSKLGNALKTDTINNPEQVSEDPIISVKAACWYWHTNNLNTLADKDDIKTITRRINGGYNGLEDRMHYLKLAQEVLNV